MDAMYMFLGAIAFFFIFMYLCVNDQSGGQPWALGPAYVAPGSTPVAVDAVSSSTNAMTTPSKAKPAKRVLMVLTSHSKLGATDEKTGWYLPEAAHPYFVFAKAGFAITWASPKGGVAPVDEGSLDMNDAENKQFWETPKLKALTEKTVKLSTCKSKDFDAVFFVGGFGTMWDFPDDADVQRLAREIYEGGGVTSAVCHGPVALTNVKLTNGAYLVKGKEVAAFTNEEEDAVKRRAIVPFTCHDKLTERGATMKKGGVFAPCVAVAGNLITGQNPPSAKITAEAVAAALGVSNI